MNHLITIHHANSLFLELQLDHFFRNCSNEFKLHLGASKLDNINDEMSIILQRIGPSKKCRNITITNLDNVINQHGIRLDYMASNVLKDDKDAVLFFFDGDCFPIKGGFDRDISRLLSQPACGAVAVSRSENIEPDLHRYLKPYPHPCFAAMLGKTWNTLKLSWHFKEPNVVTAGPILGQRLMVNGLDWVKLERTNCFNIHPLFFGVYGNLVYHHGASSRAPVDSIDSQLRRSLIKAGSSLEEDGADLIDFNSRLSTLVLETIMRDHSFLSRYLLGINEKELEAVVVD